MPRESRLVLTNVAHHVVARGVNGTPLFRHGFDKRRYLERFDKIAGEEKVLIHGYCLMRNHVHWILTPTTFDGLARLFRRVHTYWAVYFNRLTGRTGHLFQNRYHSSPLGDNHYWTALRYVEINPRRAGLVLRPEDWEFSSARAHLNIGDKSAVALAPIQSYRSFTFDQWREFLDQPDPETAKALRQTIRTSRPCGSVNWVQSLERQYRRKLIASPPGRPLLIFKAPAKNS